MRTTNDLTPHEMTIAVNGVFVDINNNQVPYRVQVKMPDCIDEFLKSNIKSRYILYTLKQGKELKSDGKLVNNEKYQEVASVLTVVVEKNSRKLLETYPSFYGKSLLDLNEREIQDFATAFGLHDILAKIDDIDEARTKLVKSFLKNILKLEESKIKNLSFYRFDKARQQEYFEFSDNDVKEFTINTEDFNCVDVEEFKEQDEVIKQGKKSVSDVLNEFRKNNNITINKPQQENNQETRKTNGKAEPTLINGNGIKQI